MRKRILAGLLALLFLAALTGCGSGLDTVEIPEARSMSVSSGETGETVTVEDPDYVQAMSANFNGMQFRIGEPAPEEGGWDYEIRWYGGDGEELERIAVSDETTIIWREYYWSFVNGSVDYAFLESLAGEGLPD